MSLESRTSRIPGWLVLVASMSAVGPFCIDMYLPGFPSIEREFAEDGVERTMAAYMLGITFAQLIYGPVSDRFGRKPPLYVGFALYMAGSIGCALANSMTMLIVMRVVQALGAGAGMVIGRAIVRDRCQPHEAARAFSLLMSIVALGPVLAPSLGGLVVLVAGWRGTFLFQALLGLGLMIAMHSLLDESRDARHIVPFSPPNVVRTYGRLLLDPTLVAYSLIGAFAMGGMFSYVAGSPTVMQESYGITPQQFGMMLAINGVAFFAASRLNVYLLRTHGPVTILSKAVWWPVGVGLLLTILATLMHVPLWLVIALQFAFAISAARVSPNTAALGLARHGQNAGAAAALMGAFQSLVSMVAGEAVAIFNDSTLQMLALIMTISVGLGALSFLWARRVDRA